MLLCFVRLLLLLLTVCVSVSLCLLCVLSVSLRQCRAVVLLGAAHLGSCHPHGSGLRRSVPHQSDCSQLRQSSSVLLPLCRSQLTAGGQVRASAGPEDSEYVPVPPWPGYDNTPPSFTVETLIIPTDAPSGAILQHLDVIPEPRLCCKSAVNHDGPPSFPFSNR